jgi:membrane protease YdiL (CAAX protease family)
VATILAYLCLAYAIVLVFFHPLRRRLVGEDFKAYLLYFAAFFFFFSLLPCLLFVFVRGESPASLQTIGLGPGNLGRGLALAAVGIPVAIFAGRVGSRDPAIRNFYPFSKQALRSVRRFVVFELAYILLYYTSWEFLYRGILFFPLIPAIGLVPALAVQTLLSTLYHIGHPPSEILAAVGAGIVFGLIAFWTGSFFYNVLIHAAVGVSTDTFLFQRFHRESAG